VTTAKANDSTAHRFSEHWGPPDGVCGVKRVGASIRLSRRRSRLFARSRFLTWRLTMWWTVRWST